ncbi:MAG: VWA domain-containing protein [Planctomycetota bacterium]
MILGEPLGLWALTGIPAVLVLHLWRARHPPRPVSGLFLYPADRRALATGRRRAPIVLRPSFWLEILVVLAATWWLTDLHWSPRMNARHLVIVLDDRWRLQAVDDHGVSCATRLRQQLDARLAVLGPGDRASLIASGAPPRLLAGPAADPTAVRVALAAWEPGASWHDLDPALTLATGISGSGAELVCASDRQPPHLLPGFGVIAMGRKAPSSGFADVRWWRDARGERIVAVIHSAASGNRNLVLRVAGVEVAKRAVVLDPATPATIILTPPSGMAEGAIADVQLDGSDALAIDNRAELIRPPDRTVRARISADAPAAAAARAALLAAGARIVTEPPADLVYGTTPTLPGCWQLRLLASDGAPTLGPFVARRDHPLLLDVDWTGALWTGGAMKADGSPLMLAGDRILISLAMMPHPQITLHVDPLRSNLAKCVAWPALFSNLVAWRAARLPGVADPDPRCGQPVTVILPPGHSEVVVRGPDRVDRHLRASPDGTLTLSGLPRPGRWDMIAGDLHYPLSALPFDQRQADLSDATSVDLPAKPLGQTTVERQRGLLAALLPLLIAAAAALLAWVSFRREENPR